MAQAYVKGISNESMYFSDALDQLMAMGKMSIEQVQMIATVFNAIRFYLPKSLVDAVIRRRTTFRWHVRPTFAFL